MSKGYLGLLSMIFLVSGCATTQNQEGKMLDASAPYCSELRKDDPNLYFDVCESGVGWRSRAPRDYEQADKADEDESLVSAVIGGVIDGAIESLLDVDDDNWDKDKHRVHRR